MVGPALIVRQISVGCPVQSIQRYCSTFDALEGLLQEMCERLIMRKEVPT